MNLTEKQRVCYEKALRARQAMISDTMTVQEIFNTPQIKAIETSILDIQFDLECNGYKNDSAKDTIKCLLSIRKTLLNQMFVMDNYYKQLLADFNEAMKAQLIEMRKQVILVQGSIESAKLRGDCETIGKCFLGYKYSEIHPVQTMRAKKMWAVLNGSLDEYVDLYWDGVMMNGFICSLSEEPDSENQMLYLCEKEDNWNEELDGGLTSDMHIINPSHHLYTHTTFSIFDLLWVRDFDIEIRVESDYKTYKTDNGDDLDWTQYDYND